jgi:lysozyme family protein
VTKIIPDTPAIEGYSSRYAAAVTKLLGVEGGYVDDPKDRGGATKYGISLRFLAAEGQFDANGDGFADFDLDMDGDIDGKDIRMLTLGDARLLYLKFFWRPLDIESLPRPIGEMVFDQAVNGGAMAAKKMLQQAINTCLRKAAIVRQRDGLLAVDGAIGPVTRGRLQAVLQYPALGMPALVEAYRDAVRNRYRAIVARNPSQKRFLAGWLARADELGR